MTYFGGKQELILKGYLDDVDMSIMIHSLNLPEDKKVVIGSKGNGFVGKLEFLEKNSRIIEN